MIEEIIKWIFIYIAIGLLFTIAETIEILNERRKGARVNRIRVIAGWLPAIFSKRVGRWLVLKKGH